MKSVTIRDIEGRVLVHIVHRTSGIFEVKVEKELSKTIDIEVRDDENRKVCLA